MLSIYGNKDGKLNQANNIWVHLMKAESLNNLDFVKQQKQTIASATILGRKNLLKKGLTWIIENGQSINFWYDLINKTKPNT